MGPGLFQKEGTVQLVHIIQEQVIRIPKGAGQTSLPQPIIRLNQHQANQTLHPIPQHHLIVTKKHFLLTFLVTKISQTPKPLRSHRRVLVAHQYYAPLHCLRRKEQAVV